MYDHWRTLPSSSINWKLEKIENPPNALRFHGSVFGSFYSVQQIRMNVKRETLDIDLLVTFGDRAPSGDFDFVVYANPQVRRIRLGRDRAVIWARDEGSGKY